MFQYSHELSVWVANKYKRLFKVKSCYENVFRLTTDVPELRSTDINVLFCYVPGAAGYHYRHVFCLYQGQIIEPLLHLNMQDKDLKAILPIQLMDKHEYFSLLVDDGQYDLRQSLMDNEVKVFNGNRINLNPVDLSDLIYRKEFHHK